MKSASGMYTIQMGVFASLENAEKLTAQLARSGITAEIRQKVIGGKELNAVYVGTYSSYDDARRQNEQYKSKDMGGIVVAR